jgi:hypothetical protein
MAPAAVANVVVRGAAGRRQRRRDRAARLAAAVAVADVAVLSGDGLVYGPVTEYQAGVVASARSGVRSHALVLVDEAEEENEHW